MLFKKFACILAALLVSAASHAAETWQEGVHYFRIPAPLPVSTPGKVEVLDVFSYACPACNSFEPVWNRIRLGLPPQAKVAYLPAAFNPQEDWPVFQRAFLAAQALGISESHHDELYDAVWRNGKLAVFDDKHHLLPASRQPTLQDLAHFYSAFGVSESQFMATANSFSLDAQVRRCDQAIRTAEVDSTPTIIINGKYRLTPSSAGGLGQTAELVFFLVNREIRGK